EKIGTRHDVRKIFGGDNEWKGYKYLHERLTRKSLSIEAASKLEKPLRGTGAKRRVFLPLDITNTTAPFGLPEKDAELIGKLMELDPKARVGRGTNTVIPQILLELPTLRGSKEPILFCLSGDWLITKDDQDKLLGRKSKEAGTAETPAGTTPAET